MENKIKKYVKANAFFSLSDSILVAVSGGIDSVTLLHLLAQLQIKKLAIVHCNFQLRGQESYKDQDFVETLAKQYRIPFYTTNFETKKIAREQKISIQEAARNLRYNWFEKIRKQNKFDYIAIAHNKNDVAETFIFNLLRGSGTKGLTGIKAKSDNIIRPLLFASRNEIVRYAKEANLRFREDSSNQSTKYSRNFIRHQIIPLLDKINSQSMEHIVQSSQKINDIHNLSEIYLSQFSKNHIIKKDNTAKIEIQPLLDSNHSKTILYSILKDYGINAKELDKIIASLHHSGKQFFTATHTILIDRTYILIYPTEKNKFEPIMINSIADKIVKPVHLQFNVFENEAIHFNPSPRFAYFDIDKLSFPLKIRNWEQGNFFYPFGLGKRKKISNFFTDIKLSVKDKSNVFLLESDNNICWIIGYRTDERFKVTNKTKTILQIELKVKSSK